MNDPLFVRGGQRVRDLRADLQRFVDLQRAALEARRQGLAVQELHDEIVGGAFPADVVQRADVRVVERGDGAGLALEPFTNLGVFGKVRGEDLDRDVAPQARVLRPVDLPHPAGAQRADDLVGT